MIVKGYIYQLASLQDFPNSSKGRGGKESKILLRRREGGGDMGWIFSPSGVNLRRSGFDDLNIFQS